MVLEDSQPLKEITIYTDGACSGNPGPGGYAAVLLYNNLRKEISGGFRLTTNNRMEIMAAIKALSALKYKCRVTIVTDSRLLVNSMMLGWARRWQENNWIKNDKKKAINPDLWQQLLDLCDNHVVQFKWVQGHASDELNDHCDKLCRNAAKQPDLEIDVVYESTAL
ncbi:ribonuclease HI [Candidatus Magnetobacterium casensis]|uniref:Ribonuclease H n=1 Tax=Candidatus Magnetobacterium casense TaxID=1455061 RepID=A0ABS6S1L5_9BACT|nr:ribonuclease HI [Candidatus Magnetobacterium casensis]MBV6342740.1 ribonuclease HI [Candidatus Magnetobacterium casensis]